MSEPSDNNNTAARRVQGWVFLTFIMVGSLVGVTGLRQFIFDPYENAGANAAWFVVQLIPLLVTIPGLMRGHLTSIFILCLASLLYFIHGVMQAFDANHAWLGYVELMVALGLTGTTAMLTRKIREHQA